MTKRKVGTLLAVTLATAAPAAAGPSHGHTPRQAARQTEARPRPTPPAATTATPRPTPQPSPPASTTTPRPAPAVPAGTANRPTTVFGIAVPRRLPSGAPACGNVARRAPPRDCVREAPAPAPSETH